MGGQDSAESSYDELADNYDSFYQSPLGRLFLEITTTRIEDYIGDHESSMQILDLGCGKCSVAREISEKVDIAHITGVDSSQEMVDQARELLADDRVDIDDFCVRHSDLRSLNTTKRYDLVLAQGGVMSHLSKPAKICDIVEENLTTDGYGFVSTITSFRYAVFSLWEGDWEKFESVVTDAELTTTDGVTIRTQDTNKICEYLENSDKLKLIDTYPIVSYLGYVPVDRQNDVLENHWNEIYQSELKAARSGDNDHGLQTEIVVKR
jgi:2-polyprenyl-3-methyl-5-hydroxy-6-metoxy-1,4-benzoquinol methylase